LASGPLPSGAIYEMTSSSAFIDFRDRKILPANGSDLAQFLACLPTDKIRDKVALLKMVEKHQGR
jgi:hypothetical protein